MPDPQPLSAALSELIVLRGYARRQSDGELHAAWKQAAGAEWAAHTRPGRIVRGVLQVDVTSAALLGELSSFHTAELTQRLQTAVPHLRIKNIRFRLA
jgi:hypothetical protein